MEDNVEGAHPVSDALEEMVLDQDDSAKAEEAPPKPKRRRSDPLAPDAPKSEALSVKRPKIEEPKEPSTPSPAGILAPTSSDKGKKAAKSVSFGFVPAFTPEPETQPLSYAPAFSPAAIIPPTPEWVMTVVSAPALEFCNPKDAISFMGAPKVGSDDWLKMAPIAWPMRHWCYASVAYSPPLDTRKELIVAAIATVLGEDRDPPSFPGSVRAIEYPNNSLHAPWAIVSCADAETVERLVRQEKVYNSEVPTLVTFRAEPAKGPPRVRWIKLETYVALKKGGTPRPTEVLNQVAIATVQERFPDAHVRGNPIAVPTTDWAAAQAAPQPDYPKMIDTRRTSQGAIIQWLFAIRQKDGDPLPSIEELTTPAGISADQPATIKCTSVPQCVICRGHNHWTMSCWWKGPLTRKGIPWKGKLIEDQWQTGPAETSSRGTRRRGGSRGGGPRGGRNSETAP